MKWILRLWLVIFAIIILWVYFLFISPKIFSKEILVVPNVVSLSEKEAIDTLEKAHIDYQITYVENLSEEVLKTLPYAGTEIKSDYKVMVYIGKVLPKSYHSFLGQVYEDVEEDIQKLCNEFDLKLNIEFEEDETKMSGIIIKESLIDGTILNQGGELCLTISKNNDTFLMPRLIGLTIDEALNMIKDYPMKVNINYYATPIEEDIVLFQSTSENTMIDKKNQSVLELYVSKGLAKSSSVDVDFLVDMIENLEYELEINYIDSNESFNKLIAFKIQKLYDINVTKYILWVTR